MTQRPASAELATVHGAPVRYLDPVRVDALLGRNLLQRAARPAPTPHAPLA